MVFYMFWNMQLSTMCTGMLQCWETCSATAVELSNLANSETLDRQDYATLDVALLLDMVWHVVIDAWQGNLYHGCPCLPSSLLDR